jgi:hypothetical protein
LAKIEFIPMDTLYDPERIVTNPNPLKNDGFSEDGVFSEKIFGEESNPSNTDTLGWIDFGNHYIINPLMYYRLKRVFANKYLDEMIKFEINIDADGNFVTDIEFDPDHPTLDFPDSNIGLIEFKDRFLELLELYIADDGKDCPEYGVVIQAYFEGTLFINKLPIFSPKLRPAQIVAGDKSLTYSEINNYYNFAIQHSNIVKSIEGDDELEDVKIQKLKVMYKLQMDVLNVAESIIDSIKSKRGVIRKSVLAGRINYSARNVIIPGPELSTNEVYFNYVTFLEVYKPVIINLMMVSEGITPLEAELRIDNGFLKFDKGLHRYMEELINETDGGMHIILNRNPSISISSIQLCKIVGVSPVLENYTLRVSNNILAGLAADFDGRLRW